MNSTFFRALLLLLPALFAAGCASFSAIAPGASGQQVEKLVGAPTSVWKNPDGSEVWEYPRGPLGVETFMVTLGSDHAVREVRQVLNDETIAKLHVGMSRDEVRRMLGKPRYIGFSDYTDEEIWSWRYQQQNPMFFNVLFDRAAGTVRTTQRLEEILFMDQNM